MFEIIKNNSEMFDKNNYINVLVRKECIEHDCIIGDILLLESVEKESLNKKMMYCDNGVITFDKPNSFVCLFSVKSIKRKL